jgi:repressor LexA
MGRTPPGETRERIFRFVRKHLLAGRPPTVRDVQRAFGFRAVQTAREHLEALVAEGRLDKEPGKARGYRLPHDRRPGEAPTVLIPLLGRVPAGPLDAAVEDPEGYVPVQTRHSPDELFGLRVRGESMTGAGILPGDVVVVRRQPSADSGEIVVARIGDEATVKRLRIRRRRAELHPENPAFDVLTPDPNEMSLLGKVVEVRRRLDRP